MIENILISFFTGLASSAIVVLLGVQSIKWYIRKRERRRSVGHLDSFWRAAGSSGSSRVFNLVIGAEWWGREGEIEPRFGYAQAYGVSQIIDCLDAVFEGRAIARIVVVKPDEPLSPQLFDEHVVLFGGEMSIAQFGTISRLLELPYYQYNLNREARTFEHRISGVTTEVISSVADGKNLTTDVGTITRIVNPTNGRLLVLLNGNYGAGLLGATLCITSNHSSLKDMKNCAGQQMVVKVPHITNNVIDQSHTVEAIRPWMEFSVSPKAFQDATSLKVNASTPAPAAAGPKRAKSKAS